MSTTHGPRAASTAGSRLTEWFEPVVVAAGYDLEELVVRAAGSRSVVRVVVDRDSGVSLDDVAALSRALSDLLDAREGDLGPSAYVLEVTSPGVDRPLTLPRHWRRNTGRLVTTAVDGADLIGRVVTVDDDGVTLAVEKGGAKKGQVRRAAGNRTLGWAELGPGWVQVEFNRPAGHRDAGLVHEGPEGPQGPEDSDDEELTADDVDEFDDGAPDEPSDESADDPHHDPHDDPHDEHHERDRRTADGAQDRGEQ